MRYEAMTGLSNEQLTELTIRVHARGTGFTSRGRPYALGLFGSVALVVCLMRKTVTQAFAGAIFGVSQPRPFGGTALRTRSPAGRRLSSPVMAGAGGGRRPTRTDPSNAMSNAARY